MCSLCCKVRVLSPCFFRYVLGEIRDVILRVIIVGSLGAYVACAIIGGCAGAVAARW